LPSSLMVSSTFVKKFSMALISKEDFISSTHLDKFKIEFMADFLMRLFQLKKVNEIYDKALPHAGIDFLNAVLTQMKIKCDVTDTERQNIPKTGAFITVSNHPFGLLDGIFLI